MSLLGNYLHLQARSEHLLFSCKHHIQIEVQSYMLPQGKKNYLKVDMAVSFFFSFFLSLSFSFFKKV